MSKVKGSLRYLVKLEQWICCVFLVIMLAVCFGAVVMRYVFSKPLVWSEEIILTILIWFGFLCISIATHLSQGVQYFPIVFGGILTALYSAVNLLEYLIGNQEKNEEEGHE